MKIHGIKLDPIGCRVCVHVAQDGTFEPESMEAWRSAIKPGDILGVGGGSSRLNRWINLGSYGWPFTYPLAWQGLSHVAIAYQHGISMSICESTTLCDSPCVACMEKHDGVQIHPLDRRIREYLADGKTLQDKQH